MLQSFLIPAIIFVPMVVLLIFTIRNEGGNDGLIISSIILVILFLVSAIICPLEYVSSRNDAWAAQSYYENIVSPNIVEDLGDTVIVSNIEAGVWQAGGLSLSGYNSYIVQTRYWQSIPITGTCVFPVPEELKYVRVGK